MKRVQRTIIVGAFEDEGVIHVEGEVDPVRDLDIISEELRLKDEEMLMSNIEKLERTVLRGDKKLKPEYVSTSFINYSIRFTGVYRIGNTNSLCRMFYVKLRLSWLRKRNTCDLESGMRTT